jgi:hypothetical protein
VNRTGRADRSATPLAKKLGIAEGDRVVMVDAPSSWAVPALPAGVRTVRRRGMLRRGDEQVSVILGFVRNAARLEQAGPDLVRSMSPTSALWIAWPRRAGGHDSDLTDQRVRDVLLSTGVVDVKVAALDDDWSGLKFVVRRAGRTSDSTRRAPRPPLKRGAAGGR